MIELIGYIEPIRLQGEINAVPGSVGGTTPAEPLLQEKIATENGEVTPDAGYDGLSKVTVAVESSEAVPFCASKVTVPTGVSYFYNREAWPEIPADVADGYQYMAIVRNANGMVRLIASLKKGYLLLDTATVIFCCIGPQVRMDANLEAAWWAASGGGNETNLRSEGTVVWWSNYDVPYGSAEAAEICSPASEPQETKPADASQYYYNGVLLPEIPDDLIDGYPYYFLVKNPGGTVLRLVCAQSKLYFSGTAVWSGGDEKCKVYYLNGTEWTEDPDSLKYIGWTVIWDDVCGFIWSNSDISNEKNSTRHWSFGTPPVPDPS